MSLHLVLHPDLKRRPTREQPSLAGGPKPAMPVSGRGPALLGYIM
jgi:hypothetical protein